MDKKEEHETKKPEHHIHHGKDGFFDKALDYIKGLSKETKILIVYFLILLVIIVPTRTVSYTAEVIYEDTEDYFDVEPYEVEETYETKEAYVSEETYEDSIPISRDVPYDEEQVLYEKVDEADCDLPSNCFCQGYGFVGPDYKCIKCACQEIKTVTKYFTEVEYETVTKTRPITEYKDILKTRTITKYNDVNKTRTIAKVKTEERTKNVNWIFGFTVPWKIG